jgi:hypothetical protein
MGQNALGATTVGGRNIAIGELALGLATTSTDNCAGIAIGYKALGDAVNTGSSNIAIGCYALKDNTSGYRGVAIGKLALGANNTGFLNIAIGENALQSTQTGCNNIALGTCTMGACHGASYGNVAVGQIAGQLITTGQYNSFVGVGAGKLVTTGCCNTGIGLNAGATTVAQNGTTNLGYSTTATTANTTCIAGACVMAVQFTATSDCRSKRNIKDLPYGLDFINLLRPVSYKWKPQADKLDKDGNLIEEGERFHTHQRTMFGLLGQQVKESLAKLGLSYNDFAGYQDKEEEHGPSGWKPSYKEENKTVSLAYDDFIAPLIKSVQELSAEVDSLKAQLKTT